MPKAFVEEIRHYLSHAQWEPHDEPLLLNSQVLQDCLEKARGFLVKNQKPEGDFNYAYDWINRSVVEKDNQVRQAGALWGLALNHLNFPSPETAQAVERGLDFFFKNSVPGPWKDSLVVAYQGEGQTHTGTVALLSLALIDYLRSNPTVSAGRRKELESKLDAYLSFLTGIQDPDGHFASRYILEEQKIIRKPQAFYDGETLLCLVKALKYLHRAKVVPALEKAIPVMAVDYASPLIRGLKVSYKIQFFYQWGCMAFWEVEEAGWEKRGRLGKVALAMSYWQIHTRHITDIDTNNGFDEGLIPTYRFAEKAGNPAAASEIRWALDKILHLILTYQVEGPLAPENPFLAAHPTQDARAQGGVLYRKNDTQLRIDITQHTSHSIILGLRYVYPSNVRHDTNDQNEGKEGSF